MAPAARCSSPRCRCAGWCSTRSPRKRSSAPSTHPRARHSARRRPGDPAHPGPALRLRGLPGAVAQGPARACRPAACSPWRPAWWSSGSASGWPSAGRRTGTSRATSRPERRGRAGLQSAARRVDGARVATGRDFDDDGDPAHAQRACHLDEAAATALAERPAGRRRSPCRTSTRSRTPAGRPRRSPPRRCSRRPAASCAFSAKNTMRVAQRLYENGYITYMRTDSHDAVARRRSTAARRQARELYGAEYVPDSPRVYSARSRTRRRRTRRSVPPATRSARRRRWPSELARRRVPALRADLEAHRRLADGRRQAAPPPPSGSAPTAAPTAATPSSRASRHRHHLPRLPRGLRRGHGRDAAARDEAADEERRLPKLSAGDAPDGAAASTPTGTRPARRRATPRRRWSRRWRRRASAARRPTPRPSPRSRTAATSASRARRWSRAGSRSP